MTRLLITTTLGALALYLLMLGWSLPRLAALAGGREMFDLRPGGYALDEARAILAALGEEGRGFYLSVQQRIDTAFPVLESAALALAMLRLFPRFLALPFAAVAMAGGTFDLLENHAVATLLRAGPEGIDAAMVAEASRWTLLKSGAVSLAMTALLTGLALAAWRRWRGAGARPAA